jgi:hypothetical protein
MELVLRMTPIIVGPHAGMKSWRGISARGVMGPAISPMDAALPKLTKGGKQRLKRDAGACKRCNLAGKLPCSQGTVKSGPENLSSIVQVAGSMTLRQDSEG